MRQSLISRRMFLKRGTVSLVVLGVGPVGLMSVGCSGQSIAQDIVNWTPALQSWAATAASAASVLLPADAALIAAALAAFDAASNLVASEAKAYLANPGQTTLQALQTAVITLQQNISQALLTVVRIVNPNSQTLITNQLNAGATIINSILALILQIKGNTVATTTAAMKASGKTAFLTIQDVKRGNPQMAFKVDIVANHYDIAQHKAANDIQYAILQLQQEGF